MNRLRSAIAARGNCRRDWRRCAPRLSRHGPAAGGVPTPSSRSRLPRRPRRLRPAGRSQTELQGRLWGASTISSRPVPGRIDLLHGDPLSSPSRTTRHQPALTAQASLRMPVDPPRARRPVTRCEQGEGGDYDWSLSPSGRALSHHPRPTMPAPSERRRRGLVADGMHHRRRNCLGALDAGTYKSQFIGPVSTRAPPGTGRRRPDYTVPDGWANRIRLARDHSSSFRQPSCRRSTTRPAPKHRRLHATDGHDPGSAVLRPGRARRRPDGRRSCQLARNGARTRHDRADADHDRRSFRSVAGHPLDPSWTGICEGDPDTTPIVVYLNPGGVGIRGDERARLILLDLGDGDVVAIAVWTRDQATFDTFIPEAMPVIESFRFE